MIDQSNQAQLVEAMVTRRDVDPLWRPADKLNVACRELQEAQEWLKGRKLVTTPLTPLPMGESPACKKRITSADGPAGVSPTKGGGSSPHKAVEESSPSKTVKRDMSASAKDDSEKCADAKASAQDREGGEDNGSSQGEDEVDETEEEVTSEAPKRRKTLVAIKDEKEHILAAGKWAGLGAVRKANEVRVNVGITEIDGPHWIDHRYTGSTRVPCRNMWPMRQG